MRDVEKGEKGEIYGDVPRNDSAVSLLPSDSDKFMRRGFIMMIAREDQAGLQAYLAPCFRLYKRGLRARLVLSMGDFVWTWCGMCCR